jgi:hypothetical protein
VVSGRCGRLSLGCLFSLLLLTVALYFGINIGEVYWRFYRYQDAMQQEVRFAHLHSDQAIARRLSLVAESLSLPDGARQVSIQRDDRRRFIALGASYTERVELPGFVRTFDFAPRAEGTY